MAKLHSLQRESMEGLPGYIIGSFVSLLLFSRFVVCVAVDTLSVNQIIRDGETIVSANETFELGFFTPGNSTNRYIGIWYKKISTGTVVWVANRVSPLTDTNGTLSLTPTGILSLQNSTGGVVWKSNSSVQAVSPVARLLDTGNLLITDENDSDQENYIWQSFDYPTNNFLPGMKFGRDLVRGIERHFVSWTDDNNPSPGPFSVWIDTEGYPQLILRRGPNIVFRAGPWNGLRFSGEPNLRPNPIYRFGFVLNDKEIYYYFQLINTSVFTRILEDPRGALERLLWNDRIQQWTIYLTVQTDNCDRYALCGAYGSCDITNSPPCSCLEGFEPNSPQQWNLADWTHGCRRTVALDCSNGEGFRKYSGVKLPDTRTSWFNQSMTLKECERLCKSNCSCVAYTNSNITGPGSGCLLWFGDLMDIRTFTENGQDIYIRMAAAELAKSKRARMVKIIVIPISVLLVVLLGLFLICVFKRRKPKREGTIAQDKVVDRADESKEEDLELPLFGLSTLLKATTNFSINNKLGEGGFGPVYKGVLEDGQEIAVKRLAVTSTQGLDEFKNEVILIAKLQHRNLVKLLGCCIQGQEKMLIYEYMPNKGLDSFIFDETQSKLLDWPKRFNIINGIARGLLYLHQDSRLRIIHRDLKASNILLNSEMNPKISDFGMARSFWGNEMGANTNRVVGTYGYMSPEYAGDGVFSVKSDVFSFGVLVLEIVTGMKNRGFVHPDHSNNLIGHAWKLHKEGRSLELVYAPLGESTHFAEVMRSIHVALLCVQHYPEDRPTMPMVVLMLSSDGALPDPKQPGFYTEKASGDVECSSSTYGTNSTNELTITMLKGR